MTQSIRTTAIMFTDVVGYTSMMGADEAKTLSIVNQMRAVQIKLIENHNGTVVKELGDGVMAYFDSVPAAVRSAVEIQNSLTSAFDARIRMGIHQAEVIFDKNDIFGDGVNIASRIEALADPGGIYISRAVQNSLGEDAGISTKHLGSAKLKNVREPVDIYAIQGEGLPVPSMKRFNALANPKKKLAILPTTIVFMILLIGVFFVVNYFNYRAKVVQAETSLDQIEDMIDGSWRDYSEAYYMAKEAERYIPENQRLQNLIE